MRTKIKTVITVVVSVSLILLNFSFSASAITNLPEGSYNGQVISLPFPSPDSFGSNSRSYVLYNMDDNRYEYIVVILTSHSFSNSDSVDVSLFCSDAPDGYSKDYYFGSSRVIIEPNYFFGDLETDDFAGYENVSVEVYRFWWYPGNNFFRVVKLNTYGTKDNVLSTTCFYPYGLYSRVPDSTGKAFPFSGLAFYNGANVHTTYNNANIGLERNVTYRFADDSGLGDVMSRLGDIHYGMTTGFQWLINQNKEIIWYLDEILNSLNGGDDYSPEPTTENQVMNDYNNAEEAVIGDSFDNLDKAADALPDLASFNSGNQRNAFIFLSQNIEFFSGMNGSGSIYKFATVMLVILGLGLASFIIGLTNRRKG